ncbi:spore germination protein [Lysinibacillus sphaericus]|uniref:Spore germination protein KA n=3 Tax=Lysinibacillus TaxID=400634 RepID=B1HP97_LYSSC|nr:MULTISPECIES: spore germination protein [Lysinibacillus]MBE5083521.1 spore germination protein [Bacillus thuringiensis]ACA40543.1 Spore germination protein KA [Lysinibacillus sphaericus C3-41]AMO33459.1 spore gernimation protein KA [Lysinibacillus sphaericus]AMR91437.1 spore gernimation protein KA [Lysinibacillus sphaericus]ANA45485.1 spore gernimation protein KA [Lysinibacillus sphaericus]
MSISNKIDPSPSLTTDDLLNTSLAKNIKVIQNTLGHSNDIIIREITIGEAEPHRLAIISIDGLSDKTMISDSVIDKLMANIEEEQEIEITTINQYVRSSYLTVGDVMNIEYFTTLYHAILNGETVILLDGFAEGIVTSTKSAKDRAVTEPSTESVIRGPRESFTETLRTNTALIRRKIKSPNLWIKSRVIGEVTQTDVAVMYIHGIASDKIVAEVLARLDRINIDGILESGYIEDFIQDSKNSMFPTVYNSERPDVIAGELLDGKVAILVDGTPFVLVVPALFTSFLQSAEDYYQHWMISSLIRILRFFGISLALVAPSLYVAITTFHQEMLPTPMLISIASQREGVPFPAVVEALIMELAFEILREAGLRMPRTIGPAVSIVGTLVIGQAAVDAGVVSAVMVIIVALTAICSFLFPAYGLSNTIRVLRFPLMILAAMFGLFGVMFGIMVIILHLCSIRSFGVPYLSPFAPFIIQDQKDAFLLLPRRHLLKRPRLVNQKNVVRGHKYVTRTGRK